MELWAEGFFQFAEYGGGPGGGVNATTGGSNDDHGLGIPGGVVGKTLHVVLRGGQGDGYVCCLEGLGGAVESVSGGQVGDLPYLMLLSKWAETWATTLSKTSVGATLVGRRELGFDRRWCGD